MFNGIKVTKTENARIILIFGGAFHSQSNTQLLEQKHKFKVKKQ